MASSSFLSSFISTFSSLSLGMVFLAALLITVMSAGEADAMNVPGENDKSNIPFDDNRLPDSSY